MFGRLYFPVAVGRQFRDHDRKERTWDHDEIGELRIKVGESGLEFKVGAICHNYEILFSFLISGIARRLPATTNNRRRVVCLE